MIKRTLLINLIRHLKKKEITFIIGPRQAGKTTLLHELKKHVEQQGKRAVYFNLDIERDMRMCVSQDTLLNKVSLEIGKSGYVFIDEIQRKGNAGLFLKGLYDMGLPYKFIVTGSGSVELKEKIHESLAGRKQMFELSTISFVEFVNLKTAYRYEQKLPELFRLEPQRIDGFLEEYMHYGGYPKLVLEETIDAKRTIMEELYQSYLERDIVNFLGIKKSDAFTQLLRVMASQIGNIVTASELSRTLGISVQTVQHYLWYMEKTFLLQMVTPFFRNVRKEITKAPTVYFLDLGMRNFAYGIFGNATEHQDNGFLFQNFVYRILREKAQDNAAKIHFWRTTNKAEVDFVVDTGSAAIPIEVKYTHLVKPTVSRSYRSFLSLYHPKHGYVIHLGKKQTMVVDHTTVHFLPYSELIFQTL